MGNPGTGIAGIDGMNGQSVTVTALPVGSAMCPAGGALLVGADGGAAAICNGNAVTREPIYGDGSAGPLTISVDTDWQMNPPTSYEFTDVTIAAGVTLTVPSGVTILATGTFTNLGTIEVQTWGGAGSISYQDEPLPDGGAGPIVTVSVFEPARGVASRAARNGVVTRGPGAPSAHGGYKMPTAAARRLIRITEEGGGAGGSACASPTSCLGGEGGGAFSVRAAGVVQAGAIHANGGAATLECAGGGAGGVIVIVSAVSISVGAITARGANGGSNGFGAACAGGGGGGGGIVHLVAPQVGPTTSVDVNFGNGTHYGWPVPYPPITASAGGGGACGGHGGSSGGLPSGYGGPGGLGLVLTTQKNPASLF